MPLGVPPYTGGSSSLGVTANQMLQVAGQRGNDHAALREAIAELCPAPDGKPSPRSLGRMLAHFEHRVVGGHCIDSKPGNYGKRWKVIEAEQIKP